MAVRRVGIFAGTFDPVHMGHVAFAESAMRKAGLNSVIFLPEPQPRFKQGVTDILHREAMLRLVCKGRAYFDVLVLDNPTFSVSATLPELQQQVKGKLVFLFGADVAGSIQSWPGYSTLASQASFIIGKRQGYDMPDIPNAMSVATDFADAKSTNVRQGNIALLLPEVTEYIYKHKLYNM